MKSAIPLVLAAVLAQQAATAPPKPAVPADRLPTLGTVGDLPAEKERLVVEVDAKGRITVEGKALDLADFRGLLLERADADREKEGAKVSNLHVVLRADRDLPWQGAQWLMQECAAPKVRVHRILFAALPEDGGTEGAVAAFLPVDAGIVAGSDVQTTVSLRLRLGGDGTAVSPSDAAPRLEQFVAKDATIQGELDASPAVPTATALAALDVFLRSGVKGVVFKGTTLLRSDSLEQALAACPAAEGALRVFLLDSKISRPDPPVPLKPVARVTGRLAGVTTAGNLLPEIVPGVVEDQPK